MKDIKLPFLAKLCLVLISLLALGYLAVLGQGILAPLFFALLLALLFLPFASFLELKLKFSRTLSTFTSLVLMLLVVSGVVYFFSSQMSDFVKDLPTLTQNINQAIHQLQDWISKTFKVNFEQQMTYLNQGLDKILSSSGIILGATVSAFSSALAFFLFSALFLIFILNYRRLLYKFVVSVFNEEHFSKVNEIIFEIQKIIKDYIVGLFIQILIVSTLTCILLSLLGVKYALLLGLLTGLLNVIPYIGIIITGFLACLISFATGGSHTLIVAIGYGIIHAIDANLILPLVIGSKVKINALCSFLALLVGEHLWGISGMFLCIPFLAIIKIIFERIDGLQPWGEVLGELPKKNRKRKKYKITKTITLEEKE